MTKLNLRQVIRRDNAIAFKRKSKAVMRFHHRLILFLSTLFEKSWSDFGVFDYRIDV
jgi:hypothetical protein